MGYETADIEDTEVTVGDLRKTDRILQGKSLMAREPQVRGPLPPLRRS
jgi:hypothetical protein